MKTLHQISTAQAIGMMGQTFCFQHLQANFPQLADLGKCRVVAVVVHEDDYPEIGLKDSFSSDLMDYYRFDELAFEPVSHDPEKQGLN